MKKIFIVFTLSLLALGVTACKYKAESEMTYDDISFDTEDLMLALNVDYYVRKLPQHLDKNDMVGLAFLNADGSLESLGGSNGFEADEFLKIIVSLNAKSVTVIGENGIVLGRSFTKEFARHDRGSDPRSTYDKHLTYFSHDDKLMSPDASSPQKLRDDDFTLVLTIEKSKK